MGGVLNAPRAFLQSLSVSKTGSGGMGGGTAGGMECFSFAHRVLIMTFMAKLDLNVSRGTLLVPRPPF